MQKKKHWLVKTLIPIASHKKSSGSIYNIDKYIYIYNSSIITQINQSYFFGGSSQSSSACEGEVKWQKVLHYTSIKQHPSLRKEKSPSELLQGGMAWALSWGNHHHHHHHQEISRMIAYVLAAHRLYRSQICVTTFQDLMGRFHIVELRCSLKLGEALLELDFWKM